MGLRVSTLPGIPEYVSYPTSVGHGISSLSPPRLVVALRVPAGPSMSGKPEVDRPFV